MARPKPGLSKNQQLFISLVIFFILLLYPFMYLVSLKSVSAKLERTRIPVPTSSPLYNKESFSIEERLASEAARERRQTMLRNLQDKIANMLREVTESGYRVNRKLFEMWLKELEK